MLLFLCWLQGPVSRPKGPAFATGSQDQFEFDSLNLGVLKVCLLIKIDLKLMWKEAKEEK
jgi:hypothetical protein